jgi:hypothetical protein
VLVVGGDFLRDKPARVLTDAEFSALCKYACVRCEHFGYCPSCRKLECFLGLLLREAPCEHFVRNVDVEF